MAEQASGKAWSGRFRAAPSKLLEEFTSSVAVDHVLARHDILGSLAHLLVLQKAGLLTRAERRKLADGLLELRKILDEGKLSFDVKHEDVHLNLEAALIERVGPLGGKLHTGRSRNDQVALDERLWLREAILGLGEAIIALQRAIGETARAHPSLLMPGYTHLQVAQPTVLAHHLLAHHWRLQRDFERLVGAYPRVNVCPLGAGALAGSTFPLDRQFASDLLAFERPMENTQDAVSDRDFIAEVLFALSLLMVHLSSLSEELVLWSSSEFGFVKLPDELATGSSMMPQKRNPDLPELVRGRTGRVIADLQALLVTLKGLPLSYNRDLQEDKAPLFHGVATVHGALEALTALLPAVRFQPERMREAASRDFPTATDLAEELVRRGVPFREAHEAAGKLVLKAEQRGVPLEKLSVEELRAVAPQLGPETLRVLGVKEAVDRRLVFGGPAPMRIREGLGLAAKAVRENERTVVRLRRPFLTAERLLLKRVKE